MDNIKKLERFLPDGAAALVLTGVNRRYLTGFASSLGYLFICRGSAVLYVDSRYYEAACLACSGCEVRLLKKLSDALCEIGGEFDFDSLMLEDEISVGEFERLKGMITYPVSVGSLSGELHRMRSVKSQFEVDNIVKAQRIAEAAFERILPLIKPGVSERELAIELDYTMRCLGAEDISFETIAVSGENSSLPHGVPGTRKVKNGDFITFDFGAVYGGYHSDMTRTVAVGSADDEMRKVYDTVLSAQENCISRLRSGLSCCEGDAAAREVIEKAGYGEFFGHGTGHSLGLEIHESPSLSPSCDDDLSENIIMTVEPGIYLPGRFGVRIEDMVLITADSCVNLTVAPKQLLIL